jgi:hypothetical protein
MNNETALKRALDAAEQLRSVIRRRSDLTSSELDVLVSASEDIDIARLYETELRDATKYTGQDFHDAVYGEGPLAALWSDKPRWVVITAAELIKKLESR